MSATTIDQLRDTEPSYRAALVDGVVSVSLLIALLSLAFPSSIQGNFLAILTSRSTLSSALRFLVPITLAALDGIFSEKAGVMNIGLEELLIISTFAAVIATAIVGPRMTVVGLPAIWIGFFAGILSSVLFSALLIVVCIRFKADQIIADLVVWLITPGLAPFAATVYYGGVDADNLRATLGTRTIPVLSNIPLFDAFFGANPAVYMILVAAPTSWYVLNRVAFGRHVRASGENPKALDTIDVDVSRVRYAGVFLSGFLVDVGSSTLSLGFDQSIGDSQTMVNGRGSIAVMTFLFGNYNPVDVSGAPFLFARLEATQIHLQQVPGYGASDSFIQTVPYVMVLVVLAFVGHTRIPAASSEHYDTGDDNC